MTSSWMVETPASIWHEDGRAMPSAVKLCAVTRYLATSVLPAQRAERVLVFFFLSFFSFCLDNHRETYSHRAR